MTATPPNQDPGAVSVARLTFIREVTIPIGPSWLTLKGAFPLTEEEWTQMLTILASMKPGLVASESPEPRT